MDKLQNYIDGKAVAPMSGLYMEVIDPSTGKAYVEAPLSRAEDVDAACQAAARCSGSRTHWMRTATSWWKRSAATPASPCT